MTIPKIARAWIAIAEAQEAGVRYYRMERKYGVRQGSEVAMLWGAFHARFRSVESIVSDLEMRYQRLGPDEDEIDALREQVNNIASSNVLRLPSRPPRETSQPPR